MLLAAILYLSGLGIAALQFLHMFVRVPLNPNLYNPLVPLGLLVAGFIVSWLADPRYGRK